MNFLDQEELTSLFEGRTTFEEAALNEPRERLRVVGVVVSPGELGTPETDDTATVWLTPAASEAFGEANVVQTGYVQLEDGPAGEGQFRDRLGTLGEGQQVLTLSVSEDAREADANVTPTVRAFFAAAALLGLVTLLVAGQILAQQAATEAVDDPMLRALGWTTRDLLRLRAAKAAVIAAVAACVALLVSIAMSPLYPIGLARIVEPDTALPSTCWSLSWAS